MTGKTPTSDDDLADTGTNDTGTTELDTPDTGTNDTGTNDTGTTELDTPDTGTNDTGTTGHGRRLRGWHVIMIAVVVVAAMVVGGLRINSLTSERDELVEEVAALEESLRIARGDLGGQIDALESDNADLGEQLAETEATLVATLGDLDSARGEGERLTGELADLTEQLAELQEIVDVTGTQVELMPDLLGANIDDVRDLAAELGVVLVELEVAPGNVIARPDDVIEQLPLEDTPLLPGSVIWVEVYTPLETDDDADE